MTRSLHFDNAQALALAAELEALAENTRHGLERLRTALGAEGACWGDDEPGRMIGETYEPEAERGLSGYENLVANIRGLGHGLTGAAETFDNADAEGARAVASRPGDPARVSGRAVDRAMNRSPDNTSSGPGNASAAAEQAGHTPTLHPVLPDDGAVSPRGGIARDPGTSESPAIAGDSGDADDAANAAAAPDNPGGNARAPDSPAPPGGPSVADADTGPIGAAGPPTGTGSPVRPEGAVARTQSPAPAGTVAAGPTGRSAERGSAVPWSRSSYDRAPAASTPPASTPWGPPRQPPAGVVPPARTDRPARAPEPSARRRKGGRDLVAKPGPVREIDPGILATVREFAARHGLIVAGFDIYPAAPEVVGSLISAIGPVLGKYPFLRLTGIEVAELAVGAPARAAWERSGPDEPDATWILLDRDAIADPPPGDFGAAVRTELGRIMAAAAGPGPARQAQRRLIEEYRRISGPWGPGDTLAAVTAGYRRWRDEAIGADARFQPATALVRAFAEVEGGETASGPARVLHRLLVETARRRSEGG